jgi:hypothetical protein
VQTTSLVHDSYLKLAGGSGVHIGSRQQFLSYASRTLRSLIIDFVREQRAQRRGGDMQLLTLDTAVADGIGADLDTVLVCSAVDTPARQCISSSVATMRVSAVAVAPVSFTAVSVAGLHALAIGPSGGIYAWGNWQARGCGNYDNTNCSDTQTPTLVMLP